MTICRFAGGRLALAAFVTTCLLIALTAPPATAAEPVCESADAGGLWTHQEVEAARRLIAAMHEKERQGASWDNPMFSFIYDNMPVDDPTMGQHPMSGLQFRLRQTIPLPGKNAAQVDVARNMGVEARWQCEAKFIELSALAERTRWEIAKARRLREIAVERRDFLRRTVGAVESAWRQGQSNSVMTLRMQVMAEKLTEKIDDLTAREASLVANLNALLQRPLGTPIEPPALSAAEPPSEEYETLLHDIHLHSPHHQRLLASVETQRLQAASAGRNGLPDPSLIVGYRIRDEIPGMDEGDDFVSAGIEFPIPFNYGARFASAKREALSRAESSQAAHDALMDKTEGDLSALLTRWRRAYDRAGRLASALIPRATSALDAATAEYRSGRAGLSALDDQQAELSELRTMLAEAQFETHDMQIQLAAMRGRDASEVAK
ncbi:MAG: TolC family protein [Deltaproteobacteria bacterium]|nr:TolC family protein [Deltaproteobacteria bacterium]